MLRCEAKEERRREVYGLNQLLKEKIAEEAQARAEAASLRRDLEHLRTKHNETQALLDTRSAELAEAQTFLTKVDGVPDSEVVQLVRNLNAKIFQTANSIVDEFESRERRAPADAVEEALRYLSVSGILPSGLLDTLRGFDRHRDSTLLQVSLQAALTSFVQRVGNIWDFEDEKHSEFLGHVYKQIKENEPQCVAGRWRTLARKQLRARWLTEERKYAAIRIITERVSRILIACGAPPEINRRFDADFSEIMELSLTFQAIAGEQVVSRDFYLVLAPPGSHFEDDRMAEEWTDSRRSSSHGQGSVVCTTAVGLVITDNHIDTGNTTQSKDRFLVKPSAVMTTLFDQLEASDHENSPAQVSDQSPAGGM
ncbi:hypothetical protein C8Q77DRAFT_1068330 [Trametes polyzona]|nr:hypothetical protein C8Q77DRAFT_1068330 [Trametes polyzona]